MNNSRRDYQKFATPGLRAQTTAIDEFAGEEVPIVENPIVGADPESVSEPIKDTREFKRVKATAALNFRTDPYIGHKNIIRTLKVDEELDVIEDLGEWLQVMTFEGEKGFVKTSFTKE